MMSFQCNTYFNIEETAKKYNINYEKCISTDELIFEIEEYLNEDGDASDLENLSSRLAEYKYYYETNK